jgi:hypothetical protein
MLAHHPITGKEIRILQSDASLSKEKKTLYYIQSENQKKSKAALVWDTISDKVENVQFRILLEDVSVEELSKISRNSKLILLPKSVIDSIGVENFKESKIQNIICLDEMKEMYPHLGGEWDGTVEDAVCLVGALLRYRYVGGMKGESKRDIEIIEESPMNLWWITQMYKPGKGKRRREIETCFQKNKESNLIDKYILLNEEKLDYNGEKVEERVIGHRITYKDVLKVALESPDDVLLGFANADIAIDDSTWRNLWSVSLENVFLAILRYDVPENGNIDQSKLFGPRADSQDTWVIRAKDIKERYLKEGEKLFTGTDIPFGKAGCDNAIALQMLRKKFLVVNPALSLKTYHYHTSGVRGYNPEDVVDQSVYMYIHATGFHDMNPKLKFSKEDIIKGTETSRSIIRRVRGDDGKAWIERMNKTLETGEKGWVYGGDNLLTPVAEPIVKVKNCFSTNNGLVFTNRDLYIGPGVKAQKDWSKQEIHGLSPTVSAEELLIAPWPQGCEEKREEFMIKYISKILRIRQETGREEAQFLSVDSKKCIECLECINWGSRKRPLIRREEDMQMWAKDGWMIPITDNDCIVSEDIDALRKSVKEWIETITPRYSDLPTIVLVDDGSKLLEEVEEVLGHAWDIKVIYPGKSSVERIWDVMRGAWGIVCMGGGMENCGWNWILPKGAYVFEVGSRDTIGIEISSAAGLEHRFIKRDKDSILEAIFEEEKEWKQQESPSTNLPVIWMPRKDLDGYFGHPGDSFREMARLWSKRGYCQVKEHPTATMVWWGEVGSKGVLLYDRPTHEWRLSAPMNEREWKKGLFGNPKPPSEGKAWFFWPRRPEYVEELVEKGIKGWEERTKRIVFYGKIENKVQEKRRNQEEWGEACRGENDEWSMVKGASEAYPFTQKQYLENLGTAKFGLCLAGYGWKCHREVECMAMGCVPLVAPECDMDSYADAPIEGVHYKRVQTPAEARQIVETMTKEEWERISNAARAWWQRNCSCEGSFVLTKKLIEE